MPGIPSKIMKFILLTVVLIFSAGCQNKTEEQAVVDILLAENTPEAKEEEIKEDEKQDPAQVNEAVATPVPPADPPAVPTPRVGLQETNPETVQLASGGVQLVEFFLYT